MAAEKREQPATGQTRIEPVNVNLSSQNSVPGAQTPHRQTRRYYLYGLFFTFLMAIALSVIFLLPHWDSIQPATDNTATSSAAGVTETARTNQQAQPPPLAAKAQSPWEQAIQSEFRRETQSILADMLEAQKTLEDHGVMLWAEAEFTTALQHAAEGDSLYNQRNFPAARDEYQTALDIFTGLVQQKEIVFQETMTIGLQALADENSTAAKEAFRLALAIDDIDRDALAGMQRAQVLDEVLALIRRGDKLVDNDQLDAAAAVYQEALDLDTEFSRAQEKLEITATMIQEREFRRNMSAGFAALENNRLEEARQSFNTALKQKPKSAEARSALNQSQHKITTSRINTLLKQAGNAEQEEHWHDALTAYREALGIDASLAAAQSGVQRTGIRAQIHDRSEQIITSPERLYDPAVYQEARAFYEKINAVTHKGPILNKQLARIHDLLDKANTPVLLRLQSDNQTNVTVHKVGNLGYFNSKELYLKPGRYVAVGIRAGYQDARQEFLVEPDKPVKVISIQAETKITAVQ
jgi:tetratricopeptide (TPR) repeat protein